MYRKVYDFGAFHDSFMQKPYAWFPVYSAVGENGRGEHIATVEIDLICEWRLHDGKLCFVEVYLDNREQFVAIVKWLCVAANALKTEIVKRARAMECPENFD